MIMQISLVINPMESQMEKTVKMILLPEASQVKMLIDTIDMYSNFCNRISKILHRIYTTQPINENNLQLVAKSKDLHGKVHREFPDINFHLVPIAFRKITKYYKYRNTPKKAYVFSRILDCNSYLISIKCYPQQPNNTGTLTIVTLAGTQMINFRFNDVEGEDLYKSFKMNFHRNYTLDYIDDKFYLSTIINDEIMPIYRNISYDNFSSGRHYHK